MAEHEEPLTPSLTPVGGIRSAWQCTGWPASARRQRDVLFQITYREHRCLARVHGPAADVANLLLMPRHPLSRLSNHETCNADHARRRKSRSAPVAFPCQAQHDHHGRFAIVPCVPSRSPPVPGQGIDEWKGCQIVPLTDIPVITPCRMFWRSPDQSAAGRDGRRQLPRRGQPNDKPDRDQPPSRRGAHFP